MQKAIESILTNYLEQETLVSGNDGKVDEELLQSLYKCLQEKGVLKEVHSFLRQRLVQVLQGTWPQLFDHFKSDEDLHPQGLKLIEDFLCSHGLLFTVSVLSTELGEGYTPRTEFGKLTQADAESLLSKLGIPPDSSQSLKILERYSEKGRISLLECILSSPSGVFLLHRNKDDGSSDEKSQRNRNNNFQPLEDRLKRIDDKYIEKKNNNINRASVLSIDQRFRHLALALERDKQMQLQLAIDKFKSEEISRIREEIETEQKFELLKKEKELLANYEEKVSHMKNNLEREKELWNVEKMQKEREIYERREELLLAIQSVREGSRIEKEKVIETASLTSESKDVDKVLGKVGNHLLYSPHTFNVKVQPGAGEKTQEQREMERAFLMKEAKLRTVIEKLEKENQKLKTSTTPPEKNGNRNKPSFSDGESSSSPMRQRNVTSAKRKSKHGHQVGTFTVETKWQSPKSSQKSHHRSDKTEQFQYQRSKTPEPIVRKQLPDTDTIAFLQYQLECQTEEIEKLRNVIQPRVAAPKVVNFSQSQPEIIARRQNTVVKPGPTSKYLETDDVDEFLREAKKRIADMEEEADTLTRIHSSKHQSPASSARSHPHVIPFPPPPTLLPSLFNRISSIAQTDRDAVPKYSKPNVPTPMPKISQLERNKPSFLNYRQPKVPLFFENEISPRFHQDPAIFSKKKTEQQQRVQSAETISEKSFSESIVSTPPPSEPKYGKGTKIRLVEEFQVVKKSSQVSLRKNPQRSNKSKEESPIGDGIGSKKIERHGSDGGSVDKDSTPLKEKASRSGALTRRKINNRKEEVQKILESSPSSVLSSSSASSIAKSPEKNNIISRNSKEDSAKNGTEEHIPEKLLIASGPAPTRKDVHQPLDLDPLAKNSEMDVDDLGELETGDIAGEAGDDFWLM